jgi:iron-sulfur cluster repair protein YtfE (RIC family)
MTDYQTLMAEHDRLVVQIDAFERSVEGGDHVAIHRAFAELSADLIAHLAKEDSNIYPRLIAGDDIASSDAALAVIEEFKDLAADWTVLIGWASLEAIKAEPVRFTSWSQELVERLRGRVRQENELLYPQALRAAHIRLRA